jgi:DNA-binding transcriptional LysR family regulator
VESRPLRYFVAVAEELNFARAADRLGIASPPLSRAIRKLEDDLGIILFERDTHHVALTPAGTVLLEQARVALDALEAAGRRAQRAANPEPKLVLAVKADTAAGLLDSILSRYAADPAATPVAIRLCGWGEHARLLREGHADAALVYEPFDHAGLDTETVTTEPYLAALAATGPLAGLDRVSLSQLGLPDITPGRPDDLERHVAAVIQRHDVRELPQLLALVELGQLVTLIPRSIASRYPRPGVAYRPVPDAPPATLVIAWPQQSRSLATAALIRAATTPPEIPPEG